MLRWDRMRLHPGMVLALLLAAGCSLFVGSATVTDTELCDYDTAEDVLALYTFDDDVTADLTGDQDATLLEAATPASLNDAPPGCGSSAFFMRSPLLLAVAPECAVGSEQRWRPSSEREVDRAAIDCECIDCISCDEAQGGSGDP